MKKILLAFLFIPLFANAQTDTIGVYLNANGYIKEIVPIRCTKTKYNALGSALTMGIAGTNLRAEFNGRTSMNSIRVEDSFLFYFPTNNSSSISALAQNPMFGIGSTPNNFGLAKLKSKSKTRELTFGKIAILSETSIGIDTDQNSFKFEKLNEGKYRVTLSDNLPTGEYAFVSIIPNGGGALLPIYDFRIEK
jgi:hypothetical protein